MSKSELFDNLDQLRRSEGKVALATLVNTRGTTPRKEGAQMLVGDGGRVLGSVAKISIASIMLALGGLAVFLE